VLDNLQIACLTEQPHVHHMRGCYQAVLNSLLLERLAFNSEVQCRRDMLVTCHVCNLLCLSAPSEMLWDYS